MERMTEVMHKGIGLRLLKIALYVIACAALDES